MTDKITSIAKYNFWDDNTPNLGFVRDLYLTKIEHFVGNSLIKVLVGQRRTGKSYLLRQIAKRLINQGVNAKNILYINTEYIECDFLSEYKDIVGLVDAYKQVHKPKGRIYLFIDEIQQIEGWERVVNSFSQDFVTEYELFISGSNSQMLSGELATLLSGRYVSFQILPFSFEEYCAYKKVEMNKQSYLEFLQTGALPELFHLPEEETKRQYVSAIKDTVLLRDIIQRYQIKDAKLLEDLFVYTVNNASNLFSITNIVNYFKSKNRKTNYETLANYLQYIENTYLIHRVERFNVKGKETVSGQYKFYINDLAYKNYLYSGYGYGIGYLLENAVYIQLIQAGYKVYVGTLRNAEIDFVAQKADKTIYIQVCYLLSDTETINREYNAYKSIKDNYEKYVLSLDDIQFPENDGIRHIQAWRLNQIL